ncbi:MAG: hypothetical protein B7X55_12775 [Rhodobacterales bacterium 34-62-10]|nr:MAG: hypothetical protein B7X55_12775 [Rhodobacterales bacterium 34-62-10]
MTRHRPHPYVGLPDRQFWKKERGIVDPEALDPVGKMPFTLSRTDRVVTAGSCFAQHVARYLTQSGFNHLITEQPHAILQPKVVTDFNYRVFSARYGNVYTARQLLQLLQRAYGQFTPRADHWPRGSAGRVVDPFRPQIQPEGFTSAAELAEDRKMHLAAVRHAIEAMDVFVFTLGLTEAWIDRRDGAVFPLAPGVAGGRYDPDTVIFHNFDETETAADLLAALHFIRARNPRVRFILTVSPVPLNATMEDRHVLLSTTWSKAVLRIAAERATRALADTCYFPSYEIITAPHVRGRYFAADCREVLDAGVAHVMGLFFHHFANVPLASGAAKPAAGTAQQEERPDAHVARMEELNRIHCDEEALDNAPTLAGSALTTGV